jgi:hypothetical protein
MPTVINCPSCERKLKVPEELLGKKVKCPTCGTLFTGGAEGEAPPEPEPEEPAPPPRTRAAAEAPSRRRRAEEDEDDDRDEDRDDDREDEEDDRPRRRRRPRRRARGEPHRGATILVLGIISIVLAFGFLPCYCSGPFLPAIGLALAIPALLMGRTDLRKINEGVMDESGRGITTGGFVCGIVGTILNALELLAGIAIMVVFIIMLIAAPKNGPNQHPFQPGPFGPGGRGFQLDPSRLPRLQDYLPRPSAGGPGL